MNVRKLIPVLLLLGYLIGIQDGNIALWKDGSNTPIVSPYRADMLPPEDQKRLKDGIHVKNKAELTRLIEDYLS